jgi:hypothetical protein
MPDFNFDAYNHDELPGEHDGENGITNENGVINENGISEARPVPVALETSAPEEVEVSDADAPASRPSHTEEVDKW